MEDRDKLSLEEIRRDDHRDLNPSKGGPSVQCDRRDVLGERDGAHEPRVSGDHVGALDALNASELVLEITVKNTKKKITVKK